MLPATIDYILSLRDGSGGSVASLDQHQVIVPNFPPLTTVNYSVSPFTPIQAYILYEFVFGEAMVPHSFDVKIRHGSGYILNVIVSGRFTSQPVNVFAVIGEQNPALNVAVTNLRLLANYYELTTSYVSIASQENYKIVLDALRRLHTSSRLENLVEDSKKILAQMSPTGGS